MLRVRQKQLQLTPDKGNSRESQNSSSSLQSPIQAARFWGRPVWSTEHAIRFFDKVASVLKSYSAESGGHINRGKVKTLKGDYIKIETLDKHFRPFYQELKRWPVLNLKGQSDQSPFESENENRVKRTHSRFRKFSKLDSRTNNTIKSKTVGTIMTRKSRPQGGGNTTTIKDNQKSLTNSDKQCGYCEICHLEYDVLKVHLKSEEHLSFVKNDDNFKSLDKLIECGANVKQFLNSHTKKHNCNGAKRTHASSETETDSDVCETNFNGGCHENDEMTFHQEKRKRTNNLKANQLDKIVNGCSKTDIKVQATRIRGLRWIAPSPESRPAVKDPPLYKVDKKESELSDKHGSNKKLESNKQMIVKLKRVRQSELNLLNNEAEQFMFPKTPTYTDSDTDDDRDTSEQNRSKDNTFDLTSSEKDDTVAKRISSSRRNVLMMKSSICKNKQIKQGNTSAQTIIKSPEPDDVSHKPRFQGAPIQPNIVTEPQVWGPDDRMGDRMLKSPGGTIQSRWLNFRKKYQSLEEMTKFNFERTPHNEPWYVTFQRQNAGHEYMYEYFGNSAYHKLPYEMGPLPPVKEDCCKIGQFVLPKLKPGHTGQRKRGGSSAYPRIPSIAKVSDRTRSSTAAIIEATKAADLMDDTTNDSVRALPLKKRKLLLEEFPRKSPREHPSTLAILSSLTNQSSASLASSSISTTRRHRDRLSSQLSIDDEDSNSTMTSQQTNKTEKESIYSTSQNMAQNYINHTKLCTTIEEMLDVNDDLSLNLEDCHFRDDSIATFCKVYPDLSEIMDECSQEELTLKSIKTKEKEIKRKVTYNSVPKLVTSGFRFNKKRRTNRTGFPSIRCKPSTQREDKDSGIVSTLFQTETTTTPDMFVSSDSQDDGNIVINDSELIEEQSAVLEETEDDVEDEKSAQRLMETKSPKSKINTYNRGRYQFEKYPKVSVTPVLSNMKTRSSDLQKRKSVTPKKYSDQQPNRSSLVSPHKYSPRKLRKPRGCWYKER